MLHWFAIYLSSYFIFYAIGYKINFNPIIVVVNLAWLAGNLAVLPGGVVIFETTMIALFNAFSIDLSTATLVTVISRVFYFFYALGIGYISLLYLNWKTK